MSAVATPPPPTAPAAVPAWRLLATLGFAGALAGGLIVTVFRATLPRIEAHRAEVMEAAVREVLHQPARWDTLYLVDGALTSAPAPDVDRRRLERTFLGYTDQGALVGAAVTAGEPGFSDVITVMFGIEPATGRLLGMTILGHKETPGLGDKIEQPPFTPQFDGAEVPLRGVKAAPKPPHEVQTITGATISSRTVVTIVNHAAARWQPLVQAYLQGVGP
ncbi:MAG: FMN-binding protein [Gemmatimonadales bacterium]|nr:FMN-binding protein [Gemmatimonadales bacterium]MDZ4390164.1 FMN-binding protein [Gemmatimonadales bacterium]